MTRAELINLGRRILLADASEPEMETLISLFNANVPHPDGSNLFFWPEGYDARRDRIADYHPSVEEVVDRCLAYRLVQL